MKLGQSPAPALSNGLYIVDILYKEKSLSFSQLADRTGFNQSSLNRYLKVLLDFGYLNKTSDLKYTLGLKTVTLGKAGTMWKQLLDNASPALRSISAEYSVTTLFVSLSAEKIIVLDKVSHPDNIMMQETGSENPGNIIAPWGMLLIADIESKSGMPAVEEYLKSCCKPAAKEFMEKLPGDIDFCRRHGYADDFGRLVPNIRRLAAPVFDSNGNVVAALGTGSFSGLMDETCFSRLADALVKNARDISLKFDPAVKGTFYKNLKDGDSDGKNDC